jgi:hypothetical protein
MRVEQQVVALAELDGSQLRQRWEEETGGPAPSISPKLLRLALGYQLQAKALGDLPASARRKLAQFASGKSRSRPVSAGMRLVREWHGTTHVATIDDCGIVHWNGRGRKSLSAVARAITGQQWSGPAFFGLRKAVGS